ncbi:hypothetical protein CBW58_20155 [Yersinia frederiksenii]|nr:hypothetical protein CBW58_20155 [Yersinia frederiksenii]
MNNRYMVVKDGVVINTVVWDGISDWEPEAGTAILAGENAGIGWLYDGVKFTAPPVPELTHDELVAQAELTKEGLLTSAEQTISLWQTKLLLGRISADEKKKLNLWVDYIEALELIDTSVVPYIEWPVSPETALAES